MLLQASANLLNTVMYGNFQGELEAHNFSLKVAYPILRQISFDAVIIPEATLAEVDALNSFAQTGYSIFSMYLPIKTQYICNV